MLCDVLLDWMVLISCLVLGTRRIKNIFQLVILVLVLYTFYYSIKATRYQYIYLFSENRIRVFVTSFETFTTLQSTVLSVEILYQV